MFVSCNNFSTLSDTERTEYRAALQTGGRTEREKILNVLSLVVIKFKLHSVNKKIQKDLRYL